ncbi:hypothetical protein MMC30_003922 [Trapelia coarctata]|nr:hypothetical protein [Trapelia coarctata]
MQNHPQYHRGYQQTPQRPPHPSARRGPGPMVGGSHAPTAVQHNNIMAAREAELKASARAKTRASEPTDKNIPEGVEDIIIGDGVKQYKDMREIERRLDAIMMRKRLDLAEIKPQSHERSRTLRIWISNTAETQPWQGRGLEEDAFDFNTGMEGTFKVKIEGRVLDDGNTDAGSEDEADDEIAKENGHSDNPDEMDHDAPTESTKKPSATSSKPRPKLSHFFKRIVVEFDRSKDLRSDGIAPAEWKKPSNIPPNATNLPATADFDCLEFERKSDENTNCTISLYRDENPERFAVSKDLMEIVDLEDGTRDRVVTGIWDYARALNLQQDEEKRLIQCDDRLRAVFKSDTIFFPHLTDLVTPHLHSLPPIKLDYTVRVDPEYHAAPTQTIYDILVPAKDTLRTKMLAIIHDPNYRPTLQELSALDKQLATVVQALNQSKAKHAFFSSMAKDPKAFLKRWISSQKRDLELISGQTLKAGIDDEDNRREAREKGIIWGGMGEEFRKGGKDSVWGTEHARESVGLMVAKATR